MRRSAHKSSAPKHWASPSSLSAQEGAAQHAGHLIMLSSLTGTLQSRVPMSCPPQPQHHQHVRVPSASNRSAHRATRLASCRETAVSRACQPEATCLDRARANCVRVIDMAQRIGVRIQSMVMFCRQYGDHHGLHSETDYIRGFI